MLNHLGEHGAAVRVESALRLVIAEGRWTTPDLGGSAGTREMAKAVADLTAQLAGTMDTETELSG